MNRLVRWGGLLLLTASLAFAQTAPKPKAKKKAAAPPAPAAITAEVEPAYFEVLPNLELQFPVSLSYNVAGNSEYNTAMNHGTGYATASIVATYLQNWTAQLSYTQYFGKVGTNPSYPEISAMATDRSFVALNLSHTF